MQYSAVVLGATGNVGGHIVQLLIRNPLCKKVVVVTRRKTDVFAARMVKIFMRRGCSIEVIRRGVLDSGCLVADWA